MHRLIAAIFAALFALSFAACGDGTCDTNADCGNLEVCAATGNPSGYDAAASTCQACVALCADSTDCAPSHQCFTYGNECTECK